MTAKERLHGTLSYTRPTLFHHEIGLLWAWDETLKNWKNQGYNGEDFYNIFPIDKLEKVPVNYGPSPEFKKEIIAEDSLNITYINTDGTVLREPKENSNSYMPQFLSYPVTDLASYRKFRRERFMTPFARRIMEGEGAGHTVFESGQKKILWKKWIASRKESSDPCFCFTARWGGFFGPLRSLLGVENACLAFYDQPELVEEFMEERACSMIRITEKVLAAAEIDMFGFWEDMAGKNGPLISPELFGQFASKYYRRVCDFLFSRGIKYIFIDSDGDARKLLPLWLDCGINGFFPCEVCAGVDVISLRREYGKQLLLFGGVDKREIAKSKNDIINEIKRITPLIEEGGYLPCFDHSAHADISWDNMRFYMEMLHKIR
ncbi:MAG TPA: hypothetical protein DC049_08355 [Spirochaetia bacterium]|nr:hypothetical protein [Spirochaetia bacterium]